MTKKLLALLLCLCLSLGIAACGDTSAPSEEAQIPTTPEESGWEAIDFTADGWSEDRSVYTAQGRNLELRFQNLEPDAAYRTVLMGMDLGGELFELTDYTEQVVHNGDGTGSYCFEDVAYIAGTYRALTVAVVGNGMVYSHTFTYEQAGTEVLEDTWAILAKPEDYPTAWFLCDADLRLIQETEEASESGNLPDTEGKVLNIIAPTQDAVYSGVPGGQFPFCIRIDQGSLSEREYSYPTIQLESVDRPGEILYSSSWGTDEDLLSANLELEEIQSAGRYRMTVSLEEEVVDSVEFLLEEDTAYSTLLDPIREEVKQQLAGKDVQQLHTYDPEALTGEQRLEIRRPQEGLFIYKMRSDWQSESWNDDMTVYTTEYSNATFYIQGMQEGVPYYGAIMGYDVTGSPFLEYVDFSRWGGDITYGSISTSLTSLPGRYEDLTLAVIGGSETFLWNFDFVYAPKEEDIRDYVYGALLGDSNTYPNGRLTTAYNQSDSGDELVINPKADWTLYGHSGTGELEFRLRQNLIQPGNYVITLTHVESQQMVGRQEYTYEQIQYGTGVLDLASQGTEGKHRLDVFQDDTLLGSVEFNIAWDYSVYSQLMALLPEKAAEESVSTVSLAQDIRDFEATLTTVETDAFAHFIRYKYAAQPGDAINSFAICSPNVKETEVRVDRKDYLHTANWALKDIFEFEQGDRRHYADTSLLDLSRINALQGEFWQDLECLDYLLGSSVEPDGTRYVWLPVYYGDGSGGIRDGQLYLFVYILYPGADAEYLDPLNYFNPELYYEHHITRMLITDQAVVKKLMTKLRGDGSFGYQENTEINYPTISADYYAYEGGRLWYISKLADRLTQLGYLTVEPKLAGYCDEAILGAIRAFERDNGLPEDGVADSQLQRLLYSGSEQRQLVSAWLDAQAGKE